MENEHKHKWKYPYPTLDFGEYGILRRECELCDAAEETNPYTGEFMPVLNRF